MKIYLLIILEVIKNMLNFDIAQKILRMRYFKHKIKNNPENKIFEKEELDKIYNFFNEEENKILEEKRNFYINEKILNNQFILEEINFLKDKQVVNINTIDKLLTFFGFKKNEPKEININSIIEKNESKEQNKDLLVNKEQKNEIISDKKHIIENSESNNTIIKNSEKKVSSSSLKVETIKINSKEEGKNINTSKKIESTEKEIKKPKIEKNINMIDFIFEKLSGKWFIVLGILLMVLSSFPIIKEMPSTSLIYLVLLLYSNVLFVSGHFTRKYFSWTGNAFYLFTLLASPIIMASSTILDLTKIEDLSIELLTITSIPFINYLILKTLYKELNLLYFAIFIFLSIASIFTPNLESLLSNASFIRDDFESIISISFFILVFYGYKIIINKLKINEKENNIKEILGLFLLIVYNYFIIMIINNIGHETYGLVSILFSAILWNFSSKIKSFEISNIILNKKELILNKNLIQNFSLLGYFLSILPFINNFKDVPKLSLVSFVGVSIYLLNVGIYEFKFSKLINNSLSSIFFNFFLVFLSKSWKISLDIQSIIISSVMLIILLLGNIKSLEKYKNSLYFISIMTSITVWLKVSLFDSWSEYTLISLLFISIIYLLNSLYNKRNVFSYISLFTLTIDYFSYIVVVNPQIDFKNYSYYGILLSFIYLAIGYLVQVRNSEKRTENISPKERFSFANFFSKDIINPYNFKNRFYSDIPYLISEPFYNISIFITTISSILNFEDPYILLLASLFYISMFKLYPSKLWIYIFIFTSNLGIINLSFIKLPIENLSWVLIGLNFFLFLVEYLLKNRDKIISEAFFRMFLVINTITLYSIFIIKENNVGYELLLLSIIYLIRISFSRAKLWIYAFITTSSLGIINISYINLSIEDLNWVLIGLNFLFILVEFLLKNKSKNISKACFYSSLFINYSILFSIILNYKSNYQLLVLSITYLLNMINLPSKLWLYPFILISSLGLINLSLSDTSSESLKWILISLNFFWLLVEYLVRRMNKKASEPFFYASLFINSAIIFGLIKDIKENNFGYELLLLSLVYLLNMKIIPLMLWIYAFIITSTLGIINISYINLPIEDLNWVLIGLNFVYLLSESLLEKRDKDISKICFFTSIIINIGTLFSLFTNYSVNSNQILILSLTYLLKIRFLPSKLWLYPFIISILIGTNIKVENFLLTNNLFEYFITYSILFSFLLVLNEKFLLKAKISLNFINKIVENKYPKLDNKSLFFKLNIYNFTSPFYNIAFLLISLFLYIFTQINSFRHLNISIKDTHFLSFVLNTILIIIFYSLSYPKKIILLDGSVEKRIKPTIIYYFELIAICFFPFYYFLSYPTETNFLSEFSILTLILYIISKRNKELNAYTENIIDLFKINPYFLLATIINILSFIINTNTILNLDFYKITNTNNFIFYLFISNLLFILLLILSKKDYFIYFIALSLFISIFYLKKNYLIVSIIFTLISLIFYKKSPVFLKEFKFILFLFSTITPFLVKYYSDINSEDLYYVLILGLYILLLKITKIEYFMYLFLALSIYILHIFSIKEPSYLVSFLVILSSFFAYNFKEKITKYFSIFLPVLVLFNYLTNREILPKNYISETFVFGVIILYSYLALKDKNKKLSMFLWFIIAILTNLLEISILDKNYLDITNFIPISIGISILLYSKTQDNLESRNNYLYLGQIFMVIIPYVLFKFDYNLHSDIFLMEMLISNFILIIISVIYKIKPFLYFNLVSIFLFISSEIIYNLLTGNGFLKWGILIFSGILITFIGTKLETQKKNIKDYFFNLQNIMKKWN
ncbi:MAG: hypothetical protein U0457_18950 [Candidatus Sericytochromatia bacterium]